MCGLWWWQTARHASSRGQWVYVRNSLQGEVKGWPINHKRRNCKAYYTDSLRMIISMIRRGFVLEKWNSHPISLSLSLSFGRMHVSWAFLCLSRMFQIQGSRTICHCLSASQWHCNVTYNIFWFQPGKCNVIRFKLKLYLRLLCIIHECMLQMVSLIAIL